MSSRGPVLGLDYGARRIGLAVSDAEAKIAFPVGFLLSRGLERDLAALGDLIAEREIKRVVVGLPLHLDGRRGTAAEAAQRFANALAEFTGLPVETQDERWTTREAERSLRESSRRRGRRREPVDAVAAALLLRAYLERERDRPPLGAP